MEKKISMKLFDKEHRLILEVLQRDPDWGLISREDYDLDKLQQMIIDYRCGNYLHVINSKRWDKLSSSQLSGSFNLEEFCEIEFNKTVTRLTSYRQALSAAISALDKEQIDVIVLKGMALGEFLYDSPAYKSMNDVDIMVPKEQYWQAIDLLKQAGFKAIRKAGYLYKKMKIHHYVPLINEEGVMIDVHWNITGANGFDVDLDDMWKNKVTLELDDFKVYRLSDIDFFNHLLIHLHYYRAKLSDSFDILRMYYHLINNGKTHDDIVQIAKTTAAEDAHYRSLKFVSLFTDDESFHQLAEMTLPRSKFWLREHHNRELDPQYVLEGRMNYFGKLEHRCSTVSKKLNWEFFKQVGWIVRQVFLPQKQWLCSVENKRNIKSRFISSIRNYRRIFHYYRNVV